MNFIRFFLIYIVIILCGRRLLNWIMRTGFIYRSLEFSLRGEGSGFGSFFRRLDFRIVGLGGYI